MRRIAFVLFASVTAALAVPAAPVAPAAQAPYAIPPGAERAYAAVKDRVDPDAAMGIVRIMDSYWRLAGNPGFNASIESIQAALGAAGLAPRVDAFPARSRGWDYRTATVALADTGEVLMSREKDRVALCINSFSTAAGVVELPLVDVGAGTPADFQGKNVKGAVVLSSAAIGPLWGQAVKARGAAGVISTAIASYIRPDDPSRFSSPDQWDVLQWDCVPYDENAKAFGFKRACGQQRRCAIA